MGLGGLVSPVSHPQPHFSPSQTNPFLFFHRHFQEHGWKQVEVLSWM